MSDANPVVGILDDEIDFVRKASTRADAAEARVKELEATDRIPADVEQRNAWAKRIVDERDAAQEAAGSAERRLRELEAEMKECSEVRAKLAVDLAEYQLRQPALEAQCAAMRGALVQISKMRCCGGWGGACGEADKAAGVADDALSGDAGRALLERDEEKDRRIEALERVADAARKYRDTDWEDRWREFDAFSNAIDVIDALEPKR